jgi:molybdate transport system substrate-binding protein
MNEGVRGISSMATRQLLSALGDACARAQGVPVRFESVGGVDAARRVQAGESFDLVVLAAEAIDELAAAGHLIAPTCRPIATSTVAIAVRAGAARPDVSSEAALRHAVLSAGRIGYSTGPSGSALLKLFARWGVRETLRDRLVQAQAGTPVAALLASGLAELGFQQFSELKDEEGIVLLGPMPPGLAIVTTFVGAVGAGSSRVAAARAALDFMASPAGDEFRRRHGMARADAGSSHSQSTLT